MDRSSSSFRSSLLSRTAVMKSPSSSPASSPISTPSSQSFTFNPSDRLNLDDSFRDFDDHRNDIQLQQQTPPPPPPPPPREARPDNQPTVVDRAMDAAVRRLAKFIEAEGNEGKVLDSTMDTRALLEDISAQVERLLRNENYNTEEDIFDDHERTLNSSAISGEDDEEGFPTPPPLRQPYHLNRSTSAKSKVKLTTNQWDNLVDRLYDSLRRHDIRVATAQQAIIAQELTDVTFTPRINQKSKQMGPRDVPLQERAAMFEARRNAKLKLERQRLEDKEFKEVTFKPKINEVSRRQASRLYDNPMDRRIEAARKANLERETLEKQSHTFSPIINKKSREIARQGRALQLAFSPTKTERTPTRKFTSEESFHPKINEYSKRLIASSSAKTPVFERLYEQGLESARKQREKESLKVKPKRQPITIVYRSGMEFILETLRKDDVTM